MPTRRSLASLALDMAFPAWRVPGAAMLPGVFIPPLIALVIVLSGFWARGDRLQGVVVAVSILIPLGFAGAVMIGLGVAAAWINWRANAGYQWSRAGDPACLAYAEKFVRLYLTGDTHEAYKMLDPAIRDRLSLDDFAFVRQESLLPETAKEVSVTSEEDEEALPSEATGPLRRSVVGGFVIASVEVTFEFYSPTSRYVPSATVDLSSDGKRWSVVDWRVDEARAYWRDASRPMPP